MIKEDVLRNIKKAEKGREIWIDLIDSKKISDGDYVILFPSDYDEWAYYGALYLDDFLASRKSERAIVLCHDPKISDYVQRYSGKAEVMCFSREDAEKIMALYSLYMFTDNLIIFSPNEPAGRNGYDITGKKGITVEDVAVIGIYGIKKLRENNYSE